MLENNTRQTCFFAECFFWALDKQALCRVFVFALDKQASLPSAFILLSIFYEALGKEFISRVPERMHSANYLALGKEPVSNSALPSLSRS